MNALVLLLLAASPAAPLNTEGFRLYKAGKYAEAIAQFRAAVAADDAHALSHYNLAATLGLVRGKGKVCEFDAYQSTVLDQLEKAVQLDEGRRKRMQQDKDFSSIRDTVRYQQLLGRQLAVEKDAAAIIVAVSWYAPAVGAYGNPVQLTFGPRGAFTVSRLVLEGDEGPKREVLKGRFQVKGNSVTLDFARAFEGKKQAVGHLTPQGHLVFDTPAWDLTDARSECEA